MRTIKNMVLVALMLGSTLGYAGNEETLKTKRISKAVRIEFQNVKQGQEFQVKDENGAIVYYEIIENNSTSNKSIDLNFLGDGKYSLKHEKDFEIIILPFEIKDHILSYDESEISKHFKPLISASDNTLKISKLNLDNTAVKIKLFYEDEMIYTETIKNEQLLERVYKLNPMVSGDFRAEVISNDRSYIQKFKI